MTILVPNTGEVITLEYVVNKNGNTQDLKYDFFTNNITPSETDTAATYTIATGGGYASKTMTGSSWTVTGGAPSSATYAQQTWTFTGALTTNPTIYGYRVTRATAGDLFCAETFPSFTPATNGDNILLTPTITAD
jgi:hypothetical protein